MIAVDAGSRAAAVALTKRELTRFMRQPSRVLASFGTPVLLWVFVAGGMSRSFMMPDVATSDLAYGAYLLPGVVTMTIMFSTIFAAISLIQDRQEGFLQSVLVSPAPAWSMVTAKVMGGAAIASVQAFILLLAAPFIGLDPTFLGLLGAVVAATLTAIGVVALGLSAAWWIDSTAGFHGVMNMVLLPMWLLSGALFPVQGSAPWLRFLVTANPLHWCHGAIAGSLGVPGGMGLGWSWLGTFGVAVTTTGLAAGVFALKRGASIDRG